MGGGLTRRVERPHGSSAFGVDSCDLYLAGHDVLSDVSLLSPTDFCILVAEPEADAGAIAYGQDVASLDVDTEFLTTGGQVQVELTFHFIAEMLGIICTEPETQAEDGNVSQNTGNASSGFTNLQEDVDTFFFDGLYTDGFALIE